VYNTKPVRKEETLMDDKAGLARYECEAVLWNFVMNREFPIL
jgi:hypothetical protein